jgi:hypothetical protein
MKIGLIVESGPQGAESQVLPKLIEMLGHKHTPPIVTFENKPKMVDGCGKAAARLIADGCRKVLIVWDLYPAWRQKGEKPCRWEDRQSIFASLQAAEVAERQVSLICIEAELEAWLIADGRALSAVLSTPTHPVRARDSKSPDDVRNPKARLRKLFQKSGRDDYSDRVHARKIVDALPDLKRLRRCASFRRFEVALGC